jgi:hypothetical protein
MPNGIAPRKLLPAQNTYTATVRAYEAVGRASSRAQLMADERLPLSYRAIGCAIISWAGSNGVANSASWRTKSTMAKAFGCSLPTVKRACRALRATGWLHEVGRSRVPRGYVPIYMLRVPGGAWVCDEWTAGAMARVTLYIRARTPRNVDFGDPPRGSPATPKTEIPNPEITNRSVTPASTAPTAVPSEPVFHTPFDEPEPTEPERAMPTPVEGVSDAHRLIRRTVEANPDLPRALLAKAIGMVCEAAHEQHPTDEGAATRQIAETVPRAVTRLRSPDGPARVEAAWAARRAPKPTASPPAPVERTTSPYGQPREVLSGYANSEVAPGFDKAAQARIEAKRKADIEAYDVEMTAKEVREKRQARERAGMPAARDASAQHLKGLIDEVAGDKANTHDDVANACWEALNGPRRPPKGAPTLPPIGPGRLPRGMQREIRAETHLRLAAVARGEDA